MGGKVVDKDTGYSELLGSIRDIAGKDLGVTIGVHGEEGSQIVIAAATNEFGNLDQSAVGAIPERSYLRSTIDEGQAEILNDLQGAVIFALDGDDLEKGLGLVGEKWVGKVKKKIKDLKEPPNADSTIRQKGSSNPLIDTGQNLRNRISWQIRTSSGDP